MSLYYSDLHMHSCLSPCGDADMTPNNLVNMSVLNGLEIIALTDHNTCKNCPAAAKVAQEAGIVLVPGMELCTSEEAHIVCLFPTVDKAMEFDAYVEKHIPPIPNKPEVFGEQLILNELDETVGHVEPLLITATDISVDNVVELTAKFGGASFPAHIDKSAYSVISSLGIFPDYAGFCVAELSSRGDENYIRTLSPALSTMPFIRNSDAHYLENIPDANFQIELPELSAEALIEFIRGSLKIV